MTALLSVFVLASVFATPPAPSAQAQCSSALAPVEQPSFDRAITSNAAHTQAAVNQPSPIFSGLPQPKEMQGGCPPELDTCSEVYQECRRSCRQQGCPAATIDPCNLQSPCASICECLFCL